MDNAYIPFRGSCVLLRLCLFVCRCIVCVKINKTKLLTKRNYKYSIHSWLITTKSNLFSLLYLKCQ